MMNSYIEFLERKTLVAPSLGLKKLPKLPSQLKPFQRDVTEWALRRGRAAVFQGTGTGKTFEQLSWARAIHEETQAPVLILAPLGVAFQSVKESEKWGVKGVSYAQERRFASSPIIITNYERRDKFDFDEFGGIVLDESSIIKHEESKTRKELIEAACNILYRLCCTATPAPNDWTELGQHAEFLGIMTAKEMLATFFVHEGAIRAGSVETEDWRLKRHAVHDFWEWVSSWAIMLRDPNELGYDEPDYVLPSLNTQQITVKAKNTRPYDGFFQTEARTLSERLTARQDTIKERVEAAVSIVLEKPNEPWIIWCNLNAEAAMIQSALPGSVNVQGSDTAQSKEQNLLGFAQGKFLYLISKPSIAGFGLNYQHCANMVFVGLNDSFESLYQAIRRCWRFGQKKQVNVYLVAAEQEGAVVANLQNKERKYEEMAAAMLEHMRMLSHEALRSTSARTRVMASANEDMRIPEWL